jgi:arylsulfatase A-like enzyme
MLTSDNGPVLFDGYFDGALEDLGDHRPAGPWSGWKYLVREGGCRVPFLVRWPGRIAPGVRSQMLCLTDLLATFAAVTGAQVPAGAAADSIDQLPVLLDDAAAAPRGDVVLAGIGGSLALREGNWKLHLAGDPGKASGIGSGANPKDTRFVLAHTPKDLLFDLCADPGENHDLATRHPERVAAMKKRFAEIRAAR